MLAPSEANMLFIRSNSLLRIVFALAVCSASNALAEDFALHQFQRQELTGEYYSEGVSYGDINGDGVNDVVHGPYWFEGPGFKKSQEIYEVKPQDRNRYANNFFSWVYDFDGDGRNDVLTAGFPGTPAYVYRNTPEEGHWPKHEVFDWVSNESPHFVDLVGDSNPELVCTRDGRFGYAHFDSDSALKTWRFQAISEKVAPTRFGHGLGVGDVDGDKKDDVLTSGGWFEQPDKLGGPWPFHAYVFTSRGGAEMHVYDVDGDGDGDVISSLAAHDYGLAWFEQVRGDDGAITFVKHLIMGEKPDENHYGLVFTELHSVAMADMDGDGLKDIVTGKTYWSHHRKSPLWDAGAVVYWFRLERTESGIRWVPHRADGVAGIGRQLTVGDLDKDGLLDIVSGGMKGCHVLMHSSKTVDRETWEAWQPKPRRELKSGLQPEEAAKQMTAPAGFRVELAAGEPLVHQPVAMAYDERGRLWVAEAYTYPIRAPEGQGKDKIIILEDSDGNGSLDKRKVFAEGLNLVSGLEVGFGGVWVGAAPYLMFIPDKDGDDRPDSEPQILLDGFGFQDTHETLNAFIWGPDGWLYGCHGVFTHSKVGKPGTPDEQRIPVNAAVWRYHPLRHEFDVFARGTSNPWGVDFNDRGQSFITACVIPHLWHIVQGGRYHRQGGRHFNPYLYDDIKTIADHAHYVGNIRDHAWWGHEPTVPSNTSAAGGGHAHCGAMIYLGDNWPDRYRNQIFMNNIHGNRVNNDRLTRRGSGYVGRHSPDFLFANDQWFRGINLRYGPDGSVLLIDWYDKNACHRRTPEIWDRTNGRVYRVTYGERAAVNVDLNSMSNAELVELHSHKNEWFVRSARKVLMHRAAGQAVRTELQQLVQSDRPTTERLRALWTLHALGEFDEALAMRLLGDADEFVRAWTIQLQMEDKEISSGLHELLVDLSEADPSPVVRLYLTSAAQRLSHERRWPILERLAMREEDAQDHNLPLMIWYGIEPLVVEDAPRALRLASTTPIPRVREFIIRRAASESAPLEQLVQSLSTDAKPDWTVSVLAEMARSFEGRVGVKMPSAWSGAYQRLLKNKDESVRNQADALAVVFGDERIFPRLRSVLSDSKEALKKRLRSLDILVRGRDQQAAPALLTALNTGQLRSPSLKALAAYDDAQIPSAVLKLYDELTISQKSDAINTLAARPAFANAMLDAIESGSIPRTDLHAYHIRQLTGFKDAKLAERIRKAWGQIRESSKEKKAKIEALKKQLTRRKLAGADVSHGRQLFDKTCASCHMLFGAGGKVGPDITGSNRANLEYILSNVVDPSAVLGKDYRMTVLAINDGRVVSGLVQLETDSALTIRTINDTVVVPKASVEERKLSELSMMPEQLLEPFSASQIRDLVAYLGSPTQVAIKGPRAPIDPKTKSVPNAMEAEKLKIVSKTGGAARSQKMDGFADDSWSAEDQLWWTGAKPEHRLTLEVPVSSDSDYEVQVVLTRARDYGIVQLSLEGKALGGPIDLYNPKVITTGVIQFDKIPLKKGAAKLQIEIVGANPKADKSYMVGIDFIRLVKQAQE